MVLEHFPARHFHAAQRYDVLARLQAHVVGDVDGRNDNAQLLRQVLTQRLDAGEKLSSLILVNERNQAVTNFKTEFIEFEKILDRIFIFGRTSCRPWPWKKVRRC